MLCMAMVGRLPWTESLSLARSFLLVPITCVHTPVHTLHAVIGAHTHTSYVASVLAYTPIGMHTEHVYIQACRFTQTTDTQDDGQMDG